MTSQSRSHSQPVHISRIRKSFGSFNAIRDFTLDVAAGEFVTFLGPSGCGKSTTLKILSGLMPQDSGEIRFGDKRIDMLPANKRNIGLVFQNYALFPHMTVAENIAFGLRMRGWSNADKKSRVEELLALVRLEGLAGRRPEQLSGGQQQRVAVARALAFKPDLVLLDEPLSNLDAKLREQVRIDLRDIQRKAGQTTVFVTHDQVEALVMSDRIVLMNAGQIDQIGTPVELYATPATEFGARFVGANNLLKSKLGGGGAQRQAVVEGAALPVGLTTVSPLVKGSDIWCCIRPEHITIRPSADSKPAAGIVATVTDKIYQGTTILIDIEISGVDKMRSERPTSEAAHINIGDAVHIDFEQAHAVPRN
ncbi:ABC transporter ATP-binding protein [Rhizobium sp. BK068]|uniref:ABC transporter ATP-binding protein n=1 Tax=Rhizobium sp. BK068 TaxID=2512130 RepID=UPI00104D2B3D|nr:ABC transporter ATP-binding protein [Rhizobium sp. BK068]TCM64561.1 iron(III) transport system ATP-binding protein/putative spermidine/putrescine transport system ATP-binding protein/spermidine/putrescine transport system ATP-binding protein [Rhizobium sp. BK068]